MRVIVADWHLENGDRIPVGVFTSFEKFNAWLDTLEEEVQDQIVDVPFETDMSNFFGDQT